MCHLFSIKRTVYISVYSRHGRGFLGHNSHFPSAPRPILRVFQDVIIALLVRVILNNKELNSKILIQYEVFSVIYLWGIWIKNSNVPFSYLVFFSLFWDCKYFFHISFCSHLFPLEKYSIQVNTQFSVLNL